VKVSRSCWAPFWVVQFLCGSFQLSQRARSHSRCPFVSSRLYFSHGACPVELFLFDDAYVRRLREGDPSTESHFVSYFNQLLTLKLRARYLSLDVVDDLRQETLARVVRALRSEGGIRQAERLGAFVNSVCNNVLQEHHRATSRSRPLDDSHLETPSNVLNLEGLLISEQEAQRVRNVLQSLNSRDHEILRAIFYEEKEKVEVCSQFGVDRDYLRVLLHRAKERLRQALRDQEIAEKPGKPAPTSRRTSGAKEVL
jgi:RNA polymerase sigma-70 factor, ECF subfamily